MSKVVEEILAARGRLELPESSLRVLDNLDAHLVFRCALEVFTGGQDVRWWWELFPGSTVTRSAPTDDGYSYLQEIVPSPSERLWFIVEDSDVAFYPVLETTARVASQLIGESFGFEYYLLPKDYSWIVCENHHGSLFACGATVEKALASMTWNEAGDGST